MAIADTVWGRLARINSPDRSSRRGSGGLRRVRRRRWAAAMLRWLRIVIFWLLTAVAAALDAVVQGAFWIAPHLAAAGRALARCAWWLARASAAVAWEFVLLGFVLLLSIGVLLRSLWRATVWVAPPLGWLVGWLAIASMIAFWAMVRWLARFCWFDLPRYVVV